MGTRAVIYTRISKDTEGLALGVARQQEDCVALIERLGFTVVDAPGSGLEGAIPGEYRDNDRGASSRSRKKRPAFAAMVASAQRGEFDVIVSYSNSRLTRRPAEFESLISLYDSNGVTIKTVVSGQQDLSTADGRAVARTIAAWDAAEAERTAERIMRKHRERAESFGLPHWPRRPFGHAIEGKRAVIVEAEAAVIRDAAERILAGASVSSLVGGFGCTLAPKGHGRGECPDPGRHVPGYSGNTLSRMLREPRLAGILVYRGAIMSKSAIPAILDVDTWRAMVAELDGIGVRQTIHTARGPRRRGYTGGRGRLSGLCSGEDTPVRCGEHVTEGHASDGTPTRRVCGGKLRVQWLGGKCPCAVGPLAVHTLGECPEPEGHGRRMYQCTLGHVTIDADLTDANVYMRAMLASAAYGVALVGDDLAPDLTPVRARERAIVAELGEIERELEDGYSVVLGRRVRTLETELEIVRRELATAERRAIHPTDLPTVYAEFLRLDLGAQRRIVRGAYARVQILRRYQDQDTDDERIVSTFGAWAGELAGVPVCNCSADTAEDGTVTLTWKRAP